jgi:hypothetical protein
MVVNSSRLHASLTLKNASGRFFVCASVVSCMRKDEPDILQIATGLVEGRGTMALD